MLELKHTAESVEGSHYTKCLETIHVQGSNEIGIPVQSYAMHSSVYVGFMMVIDGGLQQGSVDLGLHNNRQDLH